MVKFYRSPAVQELSGLSETTIWRLEKDGQFPRRRRISGNIVAWRSDEIEAWMDSRPAAELGSDEPLASHS